MPDVVQIPSQAVSAEADLCPPVRGLLEGVDLLGTKKEAKKASSFASTFRGPPQSVALIEAGATAASKWWATGLGAALIPLWGAVAGWWGGQAEKVQVVVLGGAFVVTAALVLAIGYLIASDVRGRAAASVAVIQARSNVATSIVDAARDLYAPPAESVTPELIALPSAIPAKNLSQRGNEDGWLALAIERQADGSLKYLLVKDSSEDRLSASDVDFT
jgi:hypothetical protein